MKILVLLQNFRISYRSAKIFLASHEEHAMMAGLREIPSFQTLSRRARMLDLHAINVEISSDHSMESIAAVDSFMIHTCKYSTASKRKVWGGYRDHESRWPKATKGRPYGRKCHMGLDINSLLIME